MKRTTGTIFLAILAATGIACGIGAPSGTASPSPTVSRTTASPAPDTTTPTASPTTPAPETPGTTTPPPPVAKKISVEQENATRTAQGYLDFQGFSRKGLIKQLAFEGFSAKSATAAVDSLKVDWNEQAEKVAKGYLEYQSFSRSGLVGQLKFEGFTDAQARHGVSKTGL